MIKKRAPRKPAKKCQKCGGPCWHMSKHCVACHVPIAHNKKPAVIITCPGCGVSRSYQPSKAKLRKGAVCLGCRSLQYAGAGNPAWRGGRKTHIGRLRESSKYKLWRQAVFERDNFTCVHCAQVGGELNADHIKPFAHFPKLRFHVPNGRTLCKSCHQKTDTYLSGANKYRKPMAPAPLFDGVA